MDWKDWKGKRVFLQLRNGGVYSGKVIDIDTNSFPLVFITIIDKFGDKVTVVHSEIVKIKEEENDKEV